MTIEQTIKKILEAKEDPIASLVNYLNGLKIHPKVKWVADKKKIYMEMDNSYAGIQFEYFSSKKIKIWTSKDEFKEIGFKYAAEVSLEDLKKLIEHSVDKIKKIVDNLIIDREKSKNKHHFHEELKKVFGLSDRQASFDVGVPNKVAFLDDYSNFTFTPVKTVIKSWPAMLFIRILEHDKILITINAPGEHRSDNIQLFSKTTNYQGAISYIKSKKKILLDYFAAVCTFVVTQSKDRPQIDWTKEWKNKF